MKNYASPRSQYSNLKPQGGYEILGLHEGMESISDQLKDLKKEILNLNKQVAEIQLQKLSNSQKEFLTIEDVQKLFDLSRRLQQEERSNGRLTFIKKLDGNKILYRHDDIRDYMNKYYTTSKNAQKS